MSHNLVARQTNIARKGVGIAILILTLLLVSACTTGETPTPTPVIDEDFVPPVSVTGKLVPATWASISAQRGGVLVEVPVAEGDRVAEGDVLLRLDDTDARLSAQQATAALEVAQAELARLAAGPQEEQITVAANQLEAARTAISQTIAQRNRLWAGDLDAAIAAAEAELAAARAEQLVARQQHDDTMKCQTVTQADGSKKEVCPLLGTYEERARFTLHAANERVAAAEAQLDALKSGHWADVRVAESGVEAAQVQAEIAAAQLELLKAGATPEELAVARAAVTQAQAALDAAEVELARTVVRAPFAGTIGLLLARQGEIIAPGVPLVTLGDLDTLRVETTDLDEIDVARIAEGQMATVTFDALPDRTFAGRVTRVAPMAAPGGGGVNYTVVIELDELDPAFRWGMTAFVDIEPEE